MARSPQFHSPVDCVEITAAELPLACPMLGSPIHSAHPRVYLDVLHAGEAACPYCGTRYRLAPETSIADHQFGGRDLHQHRVEPRHEPIPPHPATMGLGAANNVATDRRGRTTLEQLTDWLHGQA